MADLHSTTRRVMRVLRTRTARQALLNAGSTGLVSVLSAVFTALAARNLATSEFGSLQFALSLLQFVALFFEFGISLPASRIAAKSDADERHRVVAATLTVFAPIALSFSLVMLALSFGIDSWSHVHAGPGLRTTALIAAVYPFQLISLQLSQGVDRLHVASVTNVLGQLASVIALSVLIVAGTTVTVGSALWLRGAGLLLGSVLLVIWLRPVFENVRARVRAILQQTRQYGFSVYIGRLLSVATYNMDVLMIGILSSARAVGLYTLAGALARITLLPTIGATAALFPRMVDRDQIPPLWTRLAWLTGAVGLTGLLIFGPYVIDLAFSERYHDAVSYLLPLGAAEALRGVTLVYNQFLSAQARGSELRNTGFILTGSNLILNFGLIPPFGALGAAWASFLALGANLTAHIVYYRRTTTSSGGIGRTPRSPAEPAPDLAQTSPTTDRTGS